MQRALDLSVYSSEAIEIEVDGWLYRGLRFSTGAREVRQEVHFGDLRQADPKRHRPRDVARMRAIARVILRELVEQWRAQEAVRPRKVRPSVRRRR